MHHFLQSLQITIRDSIFEGFALFHRGYHFINIALVLYKLSHCYFKSYLLNRGKVFTTTHDANLHELFSCCFLQKLQTLISNLRVIFEILGAKYSAVPVETKFHDEFRAPVGYQVRVLADCEVG